MAWLRKKNDPISDRARALNAEIARLQTQIKSLDQQLQRKSPEPKLRSTALPHGQLPSRHHSDSHSPAAQTTHEPVFEDVDQNRLKNRAESDSGPEHFNELGVRKYDIPAFLRRLRNHFRGPATTNPKLVSYLAAGGLQGLRPLRYEKRVARNRVIALVVLLFLALLGIILVLARQH